MKQLLVIIVAIFTCSQASAGEFGPSSSITQLRPYLDSNVTYITVDNATLCGTTVFTFDASVPNGKEMYAALLTAYLLVKPVALEVSNATGCTGWGTKIQSIIM